MRYLNDEELGIKNRLGLITFVIGFFSCLFLFYVNSISMLQPHANRGMIIGVALVIVFLKFPFSKAHPVLRWVVDGCLLLVTILCYGYVVATADDIVYRLGDPSVSDMLVYLPGTLLCLEATRRTTGLPLAIVAACFILYAHFGHYLPGFFSHAHLDYARVADAIFLGIDGLFGPTTHAMISMIWFFLIFGVFLGLTGAGRAFINFAFSLTGHRRGGAAQAAVLSSLLYGFVSGSGVASVATMGTFTIPLIKSGGYRAHFAGGVEAAAAMGAQVTPPVMGGTAFLISAITGITYITICKASLIPEVLYFFCIFMCVYFEAGRLGLL
jgi:TRAP transporter 4TM/12TM fusion protein